MKKYYIHTDASSMEIEAENIEQAIAIFGECPEWATTAESFETWLENIGGFGEITEDGERIAYVPS